MEIKDYFKSTDKLSEGEYAADAWQKEKELKEKEQLTNKRFSGRFKNDRLRDLKAFFTGYSFFVVTSLALVVLVIAVPIPNSFTPEQALYAMHSDLTPAIVDMNGDYIDALKIVGTITPDGKLEVREEFILHAKNAAAKYPLRRELSSIPINMPIGRDSITSFTVFTITPRAFEIAKRDDPKGEFLPLGGLGELAVRDTRLTKAATFGETSPGEGEFQYVFYYSVDNFMVVARSLGKVFFEIGQRFNIPIKSAEVSIQLGHEITPPSRLRIGPIVVKEYGNTKNAIPVSYISLARLDPPLAGFKSAKDGTFQLWATLPNGIAKHSSVAIDFILPKHVRPSREIAAFPLNKEGTS